METILWSVLGGGTKTLAGAIVNIKRTVVISFVIKMCAKFLKGVWGKLLSRSFLQKKR